MKLKLSLLVLLLTVSSLSLNAQELRIKAGLNFSTMFEKSDDLSSGFNYKLKHGYLLGATVTFKLSDNLGLESGILANTKGYRIKSAVSSYGFTYKLKARTELLYADVPFNLKYSFPIEKHKFYFTAGPYVGVGIAGSAKSEIWLIDDKEEEKMDISFGDNSSDDYRRLDFGVNAGLGIEIKSWQIGISYALGLANISTYSGTVIKNRVLGISAAYKLGKKSE